LEAVAKETGEAVTWTGLNYLFGLLFGLVWAFLPMLVIVCVLKTWSYFENKFLGK